MTDSAECSLDDIKLVFEYHKEHITYRQTPIIRLEDSTLQYFNTKKHTSNMRAFMYRSNCRMRLLPEKYKKVIEYNRNTYLIADK